MDGAREWLAAALAVHRSTGNRRLEAAERGNLGSVAFDQGRLADARADHEAELAICEEVGDRGRVALAHVHLAVLEIHEGRLEDAEAHLDAAMDLLAAGGLEADPLALGVLADLQSAQGRHDEARRHAEQALVKARTLGEARGVATALVRLADEGALAEAEAIARAIGDPLTLAAVQLAGDQPDLEEIGRRLDALGVGSDAALRRS